MRVQLKEQLRESKNANYIIKGYHLLVNDSINYPASHPASYPPS